MLHLLRCVSLALVQLHWCTKAKEKKNVTEQLKRPAIEMRPKTSSFQLEFLSLLLFLLVVL